VFLVVREKKKNQQQKNRNEYLEAIRKKGGAYQLGRKLCPNEIYKMGGRTEGRGRV